mmetsp:Transcript_12491/g.26240  ORF Transcript_12491/g.26240 Transcript_12491/m.26240 type:complete len:1170 (+) Transcript_12491:40-3549(+)
MNNSNCGGNRSGDNFPLDGSMGQIGNPSSNPSSASFNNQQRLAMSNPNNNGGTFSGNFRGPTGTNNCGIQMNPTGSNSSMTTNPWMTASSSAAAAQTAAPAANNAQQAMMLMMMMNSNGNRNVNSGNNAASFQNNMNNSGNMANASLHNNFISPQQTAGGINRNNSNNIDMMGTMNNMNLNQNAFTNFNSVSRNSNQAIPGLRSMNAANSIVPTVDQNTWTKNTNRNFNASIYQSGNSAAINHSSFSSNSGMNIARNVSNTGHGNNWSNSASTLVDSGNSIQSTYPQQTRQLLMNNDDIGNRGSQGGGGNRTEFQRSSSDSFLNVILGGDENGLSGQARAPNITNRSQFQEPLPQNNTDDSKIDLLRLLRADSDDDMNHDGGTTEFKGYGDADDTSKPRRKSEPAISMIQDIFGTGGLDDSQNERHGRVSMEGWASPTANSPEPDFDPFAIKNLPQLGNDISNRQRHNSEPLAMDLLMDDFVDYQNHEGFSEESQWRLRATKGKNKFHGDQKRSRSLDLLSSFTCDPVDDNSNIDEYPHDGSAPNEGSKSRQDVKPKKYNSPFAAFLADELDDHDTKVKTKATGHGKPRRQKPNSAVKRSRSVDPVEMFSGLGNDCFDDESTDDDGPPTFEGGVQDDIFSGMTPEEQQRLESLGIFSRTKPKRRRSAPLLSHDFLGDLDELDDIVKNAYDENVNESFASFPDALLDSSENESLSASLRNSYVPTASLQEGPTQSPNDMHLLRMLLGGRSSQGHSNNGTSGDSNGPDNSMFLKNTNKPNCSFPEVTQSTTENIVQAPFPRNSSPSNVAVQQTPAKTLNLTSMSSGQQFPSTGFFGSNPTGAPSNFRTTQRSNGFNVMSSTHFTPNKVPSDDIDLSNILITIRNVQNQLRNLHPIVIQSGNPTAMEEIAKAFEITAQSSNYLLSSDLCLARRSLNESGVIIMNLCKLLQNQSFAGQKNYAPNFPTNTDTGVLQARPEMNLQTSYASAPLPLPPISKSKRRSSKSPAKTKVVELEDLPPQDKNDPDVIMSRLKALMERTQMSQKQLQIWDKKNGLPKSHSQTMVNSNRSRKQLQKGVILKKWNGEPLIALEGKKNEGSDDRPQKEMDTDQGDKNISFEKKASKSEAEKIVEIEGDGHSRVEGKSNEKDVTTCKRIADKRNTSTGGRDGKANV